MPPAPPRLATVPTALPKKPPFPFSYHRKQTFSTRELKKKSTRGDVEGQTLETVFPPDLHGHCFNLKRPLTWGQACRRLPLDIFSEESPCFGLPGQPEDAV